MKLIWLKELSAVRDSEYIFDVLTFMDSTQFNFIYAVGEYDCFKITELLNRINEQEITQVDLRSMTYRVRGSGQLLPLASMSTAEKVFLISYVAELRKIGIYLFRDLKELTVGTMDLYLKTFRNSEYISIIVDNWDGQIYDRIKYGMEAVI